jgi:hypothetical protein
MHGTKESFTLESAIIRGEYIAERHYGFYLDYLSNSAGDAFHFAFVPLGQQQNVIQQNLAEVRLKTFNKFKKLGTN